MRLVPHPRERRPLRFLFSMSPAAACLVFAVIMAASPAAPAPDQEAGGQEPARVDYLNAHPGVEYTGDEACRTCHASQYENFKKTGMGRSMSIPSPENPPGLGKPVVFYVKKLNESYSVSVREGKLWHEESGRDAKGRLIFSETREAAYAVGSGDHGFSYLVAKGDALFVSPISYYSRIGAWDLSPGYEEGIYRGFTRPAGELCVYCHSGMPRPVAGSFNRYQQPPFRFLSIGCERCHGPGAFHVQLRRQNEPTEGLEDSSIVNPAKLRLEIRDDVCAQCHFGGDARVLRPGKDYLDFRPGTPLGDVVSIFSVPPAVKGLRFLALDQFEQMKMSRCSIASEGRLKCISCHDPHVQLHGAAAADSYRTRCLACHTLTSCPLPVAQRQATAPPDNCIECHMPKQSLENVSHAALTDHRIPRIPSAVHLPGAGAEASPAELIYDTEPSGPPGAKPDLRTLALAYAQVGSLPDFAEKGFTLLERAAKELPNDAEIQAKYGEVLLAAHPNEKAAAARALQKAIELGSKSADARDQLAALRLDEGQVTSAMDLYKDAIQMDPYGSRAYLGLAGIYMMLKDRKNALQTLNTILKLDPGNSAARQALLKAKAMPEDNP